MARQRKTQGDLAVVLGLSQQAVSRRVSGALAFDVAELHTIADWLGVPVARLIAASVDVA